MCTSLNLRSGFRGAIRIPHIPRDLNGFGGKCPGRWRGKIVMPFKFHRNGRHHIPRQKFRVTNWRDYEAALRSRGSLMIWFTAEAIADWRAQPRATPGGQRCYSDLAIETALTLLGPRPCARKMPLCATKTLLCETKAPFSSPDLRAQSRPRRRAGRPRRNLQGKAEPPPVPPHREFSDRCPPRRPRRPAGIRRTAQSCQGRRQDH